MDLSFFRVFRQSDAQRLHDTLEKLGVRVYRSWRVGAHVCVVPEEIKPRYLTVDGSGKVNIQDPLLSHPSTPHLTPLGTIDMKDKSWPTAASGLYIRRTAGSTPEVPTATDEAEPPPKKSENGEKNKEKKSRAVIEPEWKSALSHVGPVPGLEVTASGGIRWKDGRPIKWDATRPSRIRIGGKHQDLYLPDIVLCTFVGPPPSPWCRATYKDTALAGTSKRWTVSNLKWSERRPSRPMLTDEQVEKIFTDFGKGHSSSRIGKEMHVASTTVSSVLRGLTHPERDDLRTRCLQERKKNFCPDDSVSRYMKKRLA